MQRTKLSSAARWTGWHLLATSLLVLLPGLLIPGFSQFGSEQLVTTLALAGGYAGSALILGWHSLSGKQLRLSHIAVTVLSVFAIILLFLLVARVPYSRRVLLATISLALVLPTVFHLTPRLRGVAAIGMAILAVGAISRGLDSPGPSAIGSMMTERFLPTAFYDLKVSEYRDFTQQSNRGGGISRVGDRFVAATSEGALFLFWWEGQSDSLRVTELPYRVPVNTDAYLADAGADSETFRVGDVLAETAGEDVRLLASHHFWKRDEQCFVVRVSVLNRRRELLLAGEGSESWESLYETSPCLPLPDDGSFPGFAIGGRLFKLDGERLLLTVGHSLNMGPDLPQDGDAAYGKVVVINLETGDGEAFSLGHRNPQGLYVDAQGSIWSTEHGP